MSRTGAYERLDEDTRAAVMDLIGGDGYGCLCDACVADALVDLAAQD